MAYQTQYDFQGRPIGSYWVNPGETLEQAIARSKQNGANPIAPNDLSLYNYTVKPGTQTVNPPTVSAPMRPMSSGTSSQAVTGVSQLVNPQHTTAPPPGTVNANFRPMATGMQQALPSNGNPQHQTGMSGVPSQRGTIRVRTEDGRTADFQYNDPQVDQLLKSGGVPLDPITGEAMQVISNVNGGYLVKRQGDAYGVPLNIVAGMDWIDGQQDALASYYGFNGQSPATPNSGDGRPSSYPTNQFDESMAPWTTNFQAPTLQDMYADPAYQFQVKEGEQGIERSAAARTGVLNGATMKALERFRQSFASQQYDKPYNRKLGEYQQNYSIFENNQNKRFNRQSVLAGGGQTAAGTLNQSGQNLANQTGNILTNNANAQGNIATGLGNATGSAYIAGANARNQFLQNLSNIPYLTLSGLYK